MNYLALSYRTLPLALGYSLVCAVGSLHAAEHSLVLEPKAGKGTGKHIVLLDGGRRREQSRRPAACGRADR